MDNSKTKGRLTVRYVVIHPGIRQKKPTFHGTRIMVPHVLEHAAGLEHAQEY